eukprot:1158665-Pelagomonas_calceolata.AAC.6
MKAFPTHLHQNLALLRLGGTIQAHLQSSSTKAHMNCLCSCVLCLDLADGKSLWITEWQENSGVDKRDISCSSSRGDSPHETGVLRPYISYLKRP